MDADSFFDILMCIEHNAEAVVSAPTQSTIQGSERITLYYVAPGDPWQRP